MHAAHATPTHTDKGVGLHHEPDIFLPSQQNLIYRIPNQKVT